MISDETFPIDFLDEDEQQCSTVANANTLESTETFETSLNTSQNITTATDFSHFTTTSTDRTTTIDESSFTSFSSQRLSLIPPPRAPSKSKKSFSCHDLQYKKQAPLTWNHVESKVKKLIELNGPPDRRRVLIRHKSMPISTQLQPIDDVFCDEKDPSVLLKELRKKSVEIYELKEKIDEKDSLIYSLQYEKSKMRLTFDEVRVEMFDLKKREREYKQLLLNSPQKSLKNSSTQTNELGIFTDHVRELTFGNETQTLNQTNFSELNNASSDNLIPGEVSLEDITRTIERQEAQPEEPEGEEERRKKKKFRRFFKLMSCVSTSK